MIQYSDTTESFYPRLLRGYIYPFAQTILRRDFKRLMIEADRNQYLSRDELEVIQFQKLSALLKHAYDTVPRYRDVFTDLGCSPEDIRTWDDFRKIPIFTKKQFQEDRQSFLSNKPDSPIYQYRTSGSTGTPTRFYLSQNMTAAANVCRIRALRWWGIALGDREVRIWTDFARLMPGKLKNIQRKWRRTSHDFFLNRRTFSSIEVSEESMEELWRYLKSSSPKYLFGYSSYVFLFANFLREHRYDGQSLKLSAVVISAEVIHDWQKEWIEQIFGCPVVEEYGATETGVIAYTYPCGEFHTMDDMLVVEIVKAKPQDEYGEVVVTILENWGCPLIRYNLEDLAIPMDDSSHCSLDFGFAKIKGIIGRQNDLICLSNGTLIHGQAFTFLMSLMSSVRQFQIVQKEIDFIEVFVETYQDNLPAEEEIFLRNKIHELTGAVEIRITCVSNIAREPSGKFRFVRSEMSHT